MSARPNRGRQRRRAASPLSNNIGQQLGTILDRLTALEQRSTTTGTGGSSLAPVTSRASTSEASSVTGDVRREPLPLPASAEEPTPSPPPTPDGTTVAEKFLEALTSLTTVRPNHYFVSNFDPKLHDVNLWCTEVDRARVRNKWDDTECLARIAHCLKGDASILLTEWSSNDRTWSNFKHELISLCPKHIDVANILYEVMCTSSDDYSTYAEYARRSVLRLKVVKGLSDELLVAIVLRGIKDPHIRATAINSKLQSCNLVDFLSIYVKPTTNRSNNSSSTSVHQMRPFSKLPSSSGSNIPRKRPNNEPRCFVCNKWGHLSSSCSSKKPRVETNDKNKSQTSSQTTKPNSHSLKSVVCNFCKKGWTQ